MNLLKLLSGARRRNVPIWYIKEIRITPISLKDGLTHQIYIRVAGLPKEDDYEFTGNFDNNFHNFAECVSTAMHFFGVKYGLIKIDGDGIVKPTTKGMN